MPLTIDARSIPSLLDEARARTGLADFGAPGFGAHLGLLLDSCGATGGLHEDGWRILRKVVLRHLQNRLFVHGDGGGGDAGGARVAVVVTGLPRTGTTLLHNLLSLGPGNRVLRLWEALHPVPPRDEGRYSQESLVGQAAAWLEGLYALTPGLRAIHPATVEGPEECDALLQNSFASQHLGDMYQADAYSEWLDEADLGAEYAFLARQLAGLSVPHDPPWALKSPSHLGHLDEVLSTFPDAVVVWCHRSPIEAVVSYASLVGAVRGPHRARLDPVDVGRHALQRCAAAARRAVRARAGAEERFVDVAYARLVADPGEVVYDLYRRLGRRVGPELDAAIRHWLVANPRHRYGAHRYGPADWGLDAEQVDVGLEPYLDRFAAILSPVPGRAPG